MLDKMIIRGEELTTENHGEVKTEVVAAYHELLHQLQQNKRPSLHVAGIDEIVSGSGEDTSYRHHELTAEDEQALQAAVKESPNEYVRYIDNLKFAMQNALDDVRDKFLSEQKKVTTIVNALEQKSKKIAEIHNIEVNIDTLGALIAANREKSRDFELEIQERRHELEEEIAQKRREAQHEEQKYIYQRDLAREKERNSYEMAKRDLDQELITIRDKAHKELDDREARLAPLEALQDQIAQFPAEISLAVQRAKETTAKQLTAQFEHENQLLQKEVQLHLQKIATLEVIEARLAPFEALQDQVAEFPTEISLAVQSAEEATAKQLTTQFELEKQLLQKEVQLNLQKIATLEAKIVYLESNISQFESLKKSFNHLLFNKEQHDAGGSHS